MKRIARAFRKLYCNEKGMTGLETAIILIAFVTVASVISYSVLSAGIFAAERGKETIYKGLESARATLEVRGAVLGMSANSSKLETVQFGLGLAIPDDRVDTRAISVNYWDDEYHEEGVACTMELARGSTERGQAQILENDEQFKVTLTMPTSANLTAYKTFHLQILPPTGAALSMQRTVPGTLFKLMELH